MWKKNLITRGMFLLILVPGLYSASAQVNIIPKPVSMEIKSGHVEITRPINIDAPYTSDIGRIASMLEVYADDAGVPEGAGITVGLVLDTRLGDEEYTMSVGDKGISIKGGSYRAVFYGVQSLRQLFYQDRTDGKLLVPEFDISDKPKFAYRGGLLDVGRHIFSVEEVKKFIDILALHKLNKFHWHLTNDPGWRIEIKRYPQLTTIGAYRKGSPITHHKHNVRATDNIRYGGYYTQEEIKDIVKYAAENYIDVIPEIEMPGHATAALASYNHLGCRGEGYEVECNWGVKPDVFCAGRESTFEFLENVLEEVLELFPYKTIHIGGDECPKIRWKECADCQQRIKDNNLADEHELQSYFIARMEKWLMDRGRNIIGWDEILEGGVTRTATVMSWRGSKGGIAAAKAGNYVVMAPNTHCYLDYYQSENKEHEPRAIGYYLPIEKVYELDPYDGLNEHEQVYILGVQACLWTEYISNFGHGQYMYMPRVAAVAERGWTYGEKDFDDFRSRLTNLVRVYDSKNYPWAPHVFMDKALR